MINKRAPITPITASGDSFTVGHALGQASARPFRNRVMATEEFKQLQQRWLNSSYLDQLEAAARATFPQFVVELEGMAAGAELDFKTVFAWNCRGDLRLPEEVSAREMADATDGCTTLLIPGDQTSGKPAVIAHNEDGAPEFLGGCFWVTVTPDDGTPYQSFMYPGMLPGHTIGVNARGLVQTINNVRVHDLKPGIPRQIICRAVLNSQTLDDAVSVLGREDRASGFHHNLGCAGDHRLLSVEAPASGCDVTQIKQPAAHANHLITNTFKDTAQEITRSSDTRQARSTELVTNPSSDLTKPEQLLFDRSDKSQVVFRDRDGGDDYGATLTTGVFEIYPDHVDWTLHGSENELSVISGTTHVTT